MPPRPPFRPRPRLHVVSNIWDHRPVDFGYHLFTVLYSQGSIMPSNINHNARTCSSLLELMLAKKSEGKRGAAGSSSRLSIRCVGNIHFLCKKNRYAQHIPSSATYGWASTSIPQAKADTHLTRYSREEEKSRLNLLGCDRKAEAK